MGLGMGTGIVKLRYVYPQGLRLGLAAFFPSFSWPHNPVGYPLPIPRAEFAITSWGYIPHGWGASRPTEKGDAWIYISPTGHSWWEEDPDSWWVVHTSRFAQWGLGACEDLHTFQDYPLPEGV